MFLDADEMYKVIKNYGY